MPLTAIQGPYIPRGDGPLRDWLDNFARVVAGEPWAVGLDVADAGIITALARRYAEAYSLARSPGTRERSSVAAKNAVRREVWDTIRPIAMRIKRHAGVSDARKIKLGIYPPLGGQSRILPPRTAPHLEIVEIGPRWHRLRYSDPARPSRYAKPYGTTALQLHIAVGRKPARSPEQARRVHTATRHVFTVSFDSWDSGDAGGAGRIATYFARWVTRRGMTGPWGRAVTGRIV